MTPLPRILCVDDEPNLLAALERSLDEHYVVVTAEGGAAALEILAAQEPFAVVISDMRMPEMDGAEFLTRVRERWPETVRILLTGQADVQSAMAAVNGGAIFRYLTKPCPHEVLTKALRQAVDQHRTAQAERRLLETTLSATVKTLAEILSLCAPWAFRRAAFARNCVRHALLRLKWPDAWMYEIAAALSQIGGIGVSEDAVRRDALQRPLSPADARLMAEHPETAYRLLRDIPRLERVAEIIRYQTREPPPGAGVEVARGAELLRAALLLSKEVTRAGFLKRPSDVLRSASPPIAPAVAAALEDFRDDSGHPRSARIAELQPGAVLAEDVSTVKGRLLLSNGQELNAVAIATLRRLLVGGLVREPVYIR